MNDEQGCRWIRVQRGSLFAALILASAACGADSTAPAAQVGTGGGAGAGSTVTTGGGASGASGAGGAALDAQGDVLGKVQHVVVIVLENWSFDSLYGEFEAAD